MNVLKITTTPIKLSMTSQRARLETGIPNPEVDMVTTRGRYNMHSKNIRVNIDTFQSRKDMGFRTAKGLMQDSAEAGEQAAMEATAQYAEIGNQMAQIQNGANLPDILYQQKLAYHPSADKPYIPMAGPEISWEPGSLDLDYIPGSVSFTPMVDLQSGKYIPGELNINVEQYPKVEIEYTGDPIYTPPSANPNYNE